MPSLTEYGEIMLNDYVDEWGRRRTNGLLEDGTKIIVAVGIILKQWSQIGYTSHVFNRPARSLKLAQNLNTAHVLVRNRYMRLTQALHTLHTWTVEYPALILKQWFATLRTTHVFKRPARIIGLSATLRLNHVSSRPSRLIFLLERLRLLHELYAAKPTAKKTKLFLVIGDLAIQLSND